MKVKRKLYTENLIENITALKNISHVSKVYAVVKANAYGLGETEVVTALEETEVNYAVADIDEALRIQKLLKPENRKRDILIVSGAETDKESAKIAYENGFIIGVSSVKEVKELNSHVLAFNLDRQINGRIRIHIALDTEMNRLGFDTRDDQKLKEELKEVLSLGCIDVDGIYSHIGPCNRDEIIEQVKRFKRAIQIFEDACDSLLIDLKHITKHLVASVGILEDIETFDAIRPGLSMYGFYPTRELKKKIESEYGNIIKPVIEFSSHLTHIHEAKAGERVGYVDGCVLERDTKIGTVACGYCDGYLRSYSNKAEVKIKGKRAKVLGYVCMNVFMVDLTGIDANVNDEVIVCDGELAYELADISNTIVDEVLTNFK